MKTSKIIAAAVVIPAALAAVSCGSGSQKAVQDRGGTPLVSVKYSKVKEAPAINISEWAGEPEFIALDSESQDAFTSGYKYCISENYIGIGGSMQQPYKLYDRKSGKFLHNVGNLGRGPGEYMNVYSSVIDEKSGQVYLLGWNAESVQVYDIATGEFKNEIPLKYSVPKGNLAVDPGTGDVTVAALPFQNMVPMVAWKTDRSGNVLWEVPAGNLSVVPDFSNEIESGFNVPGTFDLSVFTWGGRPDSLYVVDSGKLTPVYTIDFGTEEVKGSEYSGTVNENAPMHTYMMLPRYFLSSVSFPEQLPDGNFTTGKPSYIVTDRKTGESVRTSFFDDYMGREQAYVSFQQGYYLSVYTPDDFIGYGTKALETGKLSDDARARVSSIVSTLSEDSNNVVMIAPLK